jgi:hypothetical protein
MERRITPFAEVNFCATHAEAYSEWEATLGSGASPPVEDRVPGLIRACRYGPGRDPSLDAASRGPAFARPDGVEVG